MTQPIVSLRPLTRSDLAAITPWFEDPETCRYLGGPDWPAAMLDHGFGMLSPEPDCEGMLYYRAARWAEGAP